MLEITVNTESELSAAATQLLEFAGAQKVFLFNGEMGSGKTTFIKELCRQLGSGDSFSSPTYAIVNEYACAGGKIYHFDLYRLKNEAELSNIGIDEYLFSGHYCFFEWPRLVLPFLDKSYISVDITADENIRYIRATKIG